MMFCKSSFISLIHAFYPMRQKSDLIYTALKHVCTEITYTILKSRENFPLMLYFLGLIYIQYGKAFSS